MTDSQQPYSNPSSPPPPASYSPPSAAAPYGAPVADNPGKTLGIVAFIFSFFVQIVGLILGIIALVQSRKVGQKNGFALAAIIISIALMVLGIIIAIIAVTAVGAGLAAACADLGPGVHTLTNGQTITCS